jgi:hypothetical protein
VCRFLDTLTLRRRTAGGTRPAAGPLRGTRAASRPAPWVCVTEVAGPPTARVRDAGNRPLPDRVYIPVSSGALML